MSKRQYYDTVLDKLYKSVDVREPKYRVVIWNPNRCNLQDVVLGTAESPEYDITDHVKQIEYKENIVFESGDDSVATNCTLTLVYNPNRTPIPIDETTMLDSTPIRIYQGDNRTSQEILLFTGVIRGNPSVMIYDRTNRSVRDVNVVAVGRAEQYLNRVVVARSYAQGTDIGKACVETAIEYGNLERREIDIGYQSYALAHSQNQLIDIELMKGLAQMLFCVGKKPRFDSRGELIAADTDLDKAPVRKYTNYDLIRRMHRLERQESIYNSVRLLGLDDELTEIVEREKRLAHGVITSGYFETKVRYWVYFSESSGKAEGGRKAKDTRLRSKIHSFEEFGGSMEWRPVYESDGYTVFAGQIVFETGYAPWIKGALAVSYLTLITLYYLLMATADDLPGGSESAAWVGFTADMVLISILAIMMILGRVEWEIYGKPIQNVYQQLCATAQLKDVLSVNIREIERKNDWIYDMDVLESRAQDLLKRELIKGWTYSIEMFDDPIIEVDDVLDIVGEKFYVTSISKSLTRKGNNLMQLTAWRIS